MPQLIDVERWPGADRPRTIAYFCGALEAPWPPDGARRAYSRSTGRASGPTPSSSSSEAGAPAARVGGGRVVPVGRCSAVATGTPVATRSTPSCTSPTSTPPTGTCGARPGSDVHRLRADESGYDNLVLAGDWTDNGLNAGCIEAATLSGLQAANAVLGRSRSHRIAGTWLS